MSFRGCRSIPRNWKVSFWSVVSFSFTLFTNSYVLLRMCLEWGMYINFLTRFNCYCNFNNYFNIIYLSTPQTRKSSGVNEWLEHDSFEFTMYYFPWMCRFLLFCYEIKQQLLILNSCFTWINFFLETKF